MSAESGLGFSSYVLRKHTYLFVDTRLLLLDLFLQPPQAGSVWCSAIGLEYLDIPSRPCQHPSIKDSPSLWGKGISRSIILIGEGCDFLLGFFIICKLLLILLPILPSCTRHVKRRGCFLLVGR